MVLNGEDVIILMRPQEGGVCPPESTLWDGKDRPDTPTSLVQKTITFRFFTWVLSKHDLCSPRLRLLIGAHKDLKSVPLRFVFQQRQELHPKLANSKRHLVRVGSEDGSTSHPHVRRACELELIIFGLAQRKFSTAAGVKTANVEVQFVLRLTTDHSDGLRSHKARTHLGYNKHLCTLPIFLPASELNIEVYKMFYFSNGIYFLMKPRENIEVHISVMFFYQLLIAVDVNQAIFLSLQTEFF